MNEPPRAEAPIPWERFTAFLRQLSHDLRNQLNAAELQAALLNELTSDEELKKETKQLRTLVSKLGVTLQQLSTLIAPPRPILISYSAHDFAIDLQKKISQRFPENEMEWQIALGDEKLEVDPPLMEWVVMELFDNAFRHRSVKEKNISARNAIENKSFVFQLNEPKEKEVTALEEWERPLRSIGHGHYGLGLHRAQAIVEAHGGQMTVTFDAPSASLQTKIILPCR